MDSDLNNYYTSIGVKDEDFSLNLFSSVNLKLTVQATLQGQSNSIVKFRKIYWLHFIGIISSDDPHIWLDSLGLKRNEYYHLKEQYKENKLDFSNPNFFHPLSLYSNTPLETHQLNEDLKEQIWKDITRTFPEIEFFKLTEIRQMLMKLLFTWSKHNPEISYKQGMSEIMGFFLIMCYRDRFVGTNKYSLCSQLCSSEHIEADTFLFFSKLMEMGMRPMFESATPNTSGKAENNYNKIQKFNRSLPEPGNILLNVNKNVDKSSTPILNLIRYIFHTHLPNIDSELYKHMKSQEVEPQFFLLRWIRLLFSREFQFYNVIYIWDALFADYYDRLDIIKQQFTFEKVNLEICINLSLVIYLSIAMIKYVKSSIMQTDLGGCVKRLSDYPPVESISTLIIMALQLRNDFILAASKSYPLNKTSRHKPNYRNTNLNFSNIDSPSPVNTMSLSNTSAPIYNMDTNYPQPLQNNTIKLLNPNENSSKLSKSHPFEQNYGGNSKIYNSKIFDLPLSDSTTKALANHSSNIQDYISTTLKYNKNIIIKDELELISHDLSVLTKVLKGDLPYSPANFAISPHRE